MTTINIHRSGVRVGRLFNRGLKVCRIVAETGRTFDFLPGGRGVVEVEIEETDRPWPIFSNHPDAQGAPMPDVLLYLTDKTGKKAWRTTCGLGYHQGELANMKRRLENNQRGTIRVLDTPTARLVIEVDGKEITEAELGV